MPVPGTRRRHVQPHRQGPPGHRRGGQGAYREVRGARLRPPDHHAPSGRDAGHLQLHDRELPCAGRVAVLQLPRHLRQQLRGRDRPGEMRRLRPVHRPLRQQRHPDGPEALLQDADRASAQGASRRHRMDRGALESRAPHQPRVHRARGHRALQDRLPGAYRRSGLPEAGRPGPLSGGSRAHQEGKPAARRLRPHLQP